MVSSEKRRQAIDRVPLRDMPHSLSRAAIGEPVHRLEDPIPVTVWIVDKLGRDVLVRGEATAWSARAGHVRFIDTTGREGFVWAWASAITRR